MSTIKSQIGKWIRTERIVDTKVETTVDNDTNNRWDEATVKTRNTIRRKRLLVDIDKAIELARPAGHSGLRIIREARPSEVK